MITHAERQHLKSVSALARNRYLTPGMIALGLLALLGAAIDVYSAAKFAGVPHVTWKALLLLWKGHINWAAVSACDGSRALDLLSTALWQAIAGSLIIAEAVSLRRRGRFYERLRKELYVGTP